MNDFRIESNISKRKYGEKINKNIFQYFYDLLLFPLIATLPYRWVQILRLTDLGRERRRAVIPYLNGKILDVGSGPINELKHEYIKGEDITSCDIVVWGDLDAVCSAEKLSFGNGNFDVVTMLACLNHIPKRDVALNEVYRVLRDDGIVVVTMINSFIGFLVHKICFWFDYDHSRGMEQEELLGLSSDYVKELLRKSGFKNIREKSFLYGLNKVFIGEKK